ncbi:hypothetical protein VTK56DRAFT_9127 [Thermocarpiscus australiensis]
MSLTAASTLPRRARLSRAASSGAFGSLGRASVAYQRRHQTRGFRFGRLWWSYFDSELHRDVCRRHRGLRYNQYAEFLSRRLSGEKHTLSEDAKSALKRVVNNYWHSDRPASWAAGRYINTHAAPRSQDNSDSVRPGQNIEDAERAPLEHLLFGKESQQLKSKGQAGAVPSQNSPGSDYIIDPITNRKVFKNPLRYKLPPSEGGVEIPVTTFKSYRSQFAPNKASGVEDTQPPIFYDGPPPEAELKEYRQVEVDEVRWDSDTPSADAGSSPVTASESKRPAVGHHDEPVPGLIDTLGQEYDGVHWHQNHGIASASAVSTIGSWDVRPGASAYPDLHKYRTAMDSDDEPTFEEPVPQSYKDLDKYAAVGYQDPEGKLPELEGTQAHEDSTESEELSKYVAFRSHEPDGKYAQRRPEDPEDLSKYVAFRSHEPDGKYVQRRPENPEDLSKYGPVLSHEPDGKYAETEPEPDPAELVEYRKPFLSHEPDGMYAASYAELERDRDELSQYQAFRSHEPDGKYAANYAEPKPDSAELANYGPFRSHEPDGKYAAENTVPASEPAESCEDQAPRSQNEGTPYRKMVEELMARSVAEPDAEDYAASSPISNTHIDAPEYREDQRHLTGNYVRDFPEDFAKTWVKETSEAKSSPLPTNSDDCSGSGPQAPEQRELEGLMQPSLERYNKPKAAEAPDTPAHGKLGTETASQADASQPTPPANPSKPTLYKILVYDPTMQTIEVAETTSIVPDSATPLTPAEILLRISNPARFFPHFGPLQAQGFEIVSGSGDVLIFRKVREAVAETEKSEKATSDTQRATEAVVNPPAVNPIDMTGERRDYTVAAGRFASPTGFVNYDLPPPSVAHTDMPPRHESETNARYEQSDSRGEKSEWDKKEKRSLPKRVAVGAAWLAGISYSLGVVSEYFKTGGSDDKGSKGF